MARRGDKSSAKKIAAIMRAFNIERTTCRCANCYKIISCESRISKYNHICR